MKKIIIVIVLLLSAYSMDAQQNNCHVLCHNGTLLIGVNTNAKDMHIAHGDGYIGEVCDYEEQGNECETLSVPKFDINKEFPLNLEYRVYNINGALLMTGVTTYNMREYLPKTQVIVLDVKTYTSVKLIIE